MSIKSVLILSCAFLLAGCSTSNPILQIRSLSATTAFAQKNEKHPENTGSFSGIDGIRQMSLARDGKNVDILFVHGIGWTQSSHERQFGFDLAESVIEAYGGERSWESANDLCPLSPRESENLNGLRFVSDNPNSYFSLKDDAESKINIFNLGCLDRIVIKTKQNFTVTIYRYFWDDALWNNMEYVHLGYDDQISSGGPGYDDIYGFRAKGSAKLKDEVMTWGLVDAAAYLGPAGDYIREGIRGAICAVISGQDDYRSIGTKREDEPSKVSPKNACSSQLIPKNPLVLMAHSLGSRAVFDVINTYLRDDLAGRLNSLPNKSIDSYFLANQIPLFGVGMIRPLEIGANASSSMSESMRSFSPNNGKVEKLKKDLRFVAFSEINDPLTYELVPYFEHLYYRRCYGYQKDFQSGIYAHCKHKESDDYHWRRTSLMGESGLTIRQNLVAELGFDVVDVRVSFAYVYPFVNLADPAKAHTDYLRGSREISHVLFCGVAEGKINDGNDGCMAYQ